MDKLIEDLKAANEGSPELDARIWAKLHNVEFDYVDSKHPTDPLSYRWVDKEGNRYNCWYNQAFTRFVDAALTLIPDNHRYIISVPGYIDGVYQDGKAVCDIHSPMSSGGGPCWRIAASTLPLAICIAALKSTESQQTRS